MKNKIFISKLLFPILIFVSLSVVAQIPQKMSYQAVVRDSENKIITNSDIGVKISILKGTVAVYVETHNAVSNENGLISLEIGGGSSANDFSAIQWFDGIYYLKTEFDITGGTSYQLAGTSQLLSVPYALYSKTSESIPIGQNVGDMLYWDGAKWAILPVGQSRTALILCNGVPTWGGCDEDNEPIFIVENKDGVNVFAVYGDGVIVNVPENNEGKTARGGFAVGGYTSAKTGIQDYLIVTPDSVRVYVKDEALEKTARGGFAVGGYTTNKEGSLDNYFQVTNDSIFVSTTLIATGNINITGDLNIGGGIVNLPTVQTVDAYSEGNVYFSGQILDNGGGEIIEIGFIYGLTDIPDSEWTKLVVDLAVLSEGFFYVNIDPSVFMPETTYFVRAFAKNNAGSGFGQILEFFTPTDNGQGTVIDEDGNVYQTLYFAGNRWMVEDLRTTKYNDGAPINTNLDNASWQGATFGAFSIYPHEGIFTTQDEMKQAYGVLYNWHALETAILCPAGWRVPSLSDWNMLLNEVEGPAVAGRELKSLRTDPDPHPRWNSGNIATNSVNFSALPGGYRSSTGTFFGLGSSVTYWAADDAGSLETFALNIAYNFIDIAQQLYLKTSGYSVRCVKNTK
jgi:uncharacterized protein (TIGR02145 family)